MKIGILRNPLGIGGAELSLLDLAINLKKMGHNVWMHFDAGDSGSMQEFNKHGRLANRYGNEASFIFKNNDIVNEKWAVNELKNTDVVFIIHRHLFSKRLAVAVNGVSKKIVYAPGKNSHHIYGKYDGIDSNGHFIKNINNIIFNSKYTLNRHNNIDYPVNLKRVFRHIHPPINLDYYKARETKINRDFARSKMGFDESKFHVGLVGRLIPSKEPLAAIDIAKKTLKMGVPLHLHFIGDGKLRGALEKKIKAEGLTKYVTIWGMLNDPLEHISCLDSVLHLCKYESLSRALRESMLMRRPIVAFNGAGNVELMRDGRFKKILFNKNLEAADKIKFLYNNNVYRKNIGNLCHKSICDMEIGALKIIEDLIR